MIIEECNDIVKSLNFNNLKNKSVLVTGASGLIGVYMISCLKLLKEEHNIEIFAWIKSDISISHKHIFEGVRIIKGDITDVVCFQDLPSFDYIIHAAGYGQPGKFLEDKIKTITLNTLSTIQLLNKLKKAGTFLFVSTSELYSGLDVENITEDECGVTSTDHPRACYIEGKRCGEAICYSFLQKRVNVKIARLSLAYGPGTRINDQRVLNSLIQKGLLNPYIELLDDGSAIRTYCYITDVIEMLWNILLHSKEVLYNVSGRSKITIKELAETIGKELDRKVKLPSICKALTGNPKIVNVSSEKYIQEFKKTSFKSLKEGLKTTIKWQREIYKNETNNI